MRVGVRRVIHTVLWRAKCHSVCVLCARVWRPPTSRWEKKSTSSRDEKGMSAPIPPMIGSDGEYERIKDDAGALRGSHGEEGR